MGGVWKEHLGWLPINSFIWIDFRCSMVGSIVPPFSEREPLFPLMLLFIGEAMKIIFQTFVGDFSLTICFWVIS